MGCAKMSCMGCTRQKLPFAIYHGIQYKDVPPIAQGNAKNVSLHEGIVQSQLGSCELGVVVEGRILFLH